MKKLAAMLMLATALVAPGVAMARDVTIQAQVVRYSGNAAYLAVYLTDSSGVYQRTLWVSGRKMRYLGEMRGWAAGASRDSALTFDGISGASVGGGQTLTVHADLADSLIDAGYQIHVDSAVENGGVYSNDAVIGLASTPSTVAGTGYVGTLSVNM